MLLLIGTCTLALLDASEELAAFRPSVVDKGFNVLLQAGHRLLHIRVELLGTLQACHEIVEALIDPPILGHNSVSLSRERFILALLGPHTLILQQIRIRSCKFFEERRLLVVGLQNAVLVGPELLKLSLEELRLLVRNSLLVEDQDVGDVVRVDLRSQYDAVTSRTADIPCSSDQSKSGSALS